MFRRKIQSTGIACFLPVREINGVANCPLTMILLWQALLAHPEIEKRWMPPHIRHVSQWILIMIPVIEQIVHADEAAREQVAAARAESDLIRLQAEQTAKETAASRLHALAETVRAEQEIILADARSRAATIAAETDAYIEALQQKKLAVQHDLLEALMKKVVGA
jgi:vacuolar-type H+-ATPase subunit H